ncbi:9864_t:CDS:1, partial [Dentiscutata heterogama]
MRCTITSSDCFAIVTSRAVTPEARGDLWSVWRSNCTTVIRVDQLPKIGLPAERIENVENV